MARTQITRHDIRLACPDVDSLALNADYMPLCSGSVPYDYVRPAIDYLYNVIISLATEIYGEEPSGTRDGSNLLFTAAHTYISGKMRVMLNGLDLRTGQDWSEGPGGAEVTLAYGVYNHDDLLVNYRY